MAILGFLVKMPRVVDERSWRATDLD